MTHMQSGKGSDNIFSRALFAALATLSCMLPYAGAHAQTDKGLPVIIPPAAPDYYRLTSNDLGKDMQQLGAAIGANLQKLQTNLATLKTLNSQANQEALNSLGKNHGNAPALGTDFRKGVSGINLKQMAQDSTALSNNVAHALSDYFPAMANFSKGIGATSTPDLLVMLLKGANSREDVKKNEGQIQEKFAPVGYVAEQMSIMIELNMALGTLNSNLTSINSTYRNLLSLSAQKSATLVKMPDLPTRLGALDSLANGELKNLAGLSTTIEGINGKYDELTAKGGMKVVFTNDDAGKALGEANQAVGAFANQLSSSSRQMGAVLGFPPPPPDEPLSLSALGAAKPPSAER